jgi:NAD(P)-dependent dehydrogenase (short-subunit alcohol dehydrogenase family)
MIQPATQTGVTAIQLADLRGRSALVTGSSRGIGRAVVDALIAHDVRCFGLADYGFSAELRPRVISVRCDLSDAGAIEEAIARYRRRPSYWISWSMSPGPMRSTGSRRAESMFGTPSSTSICAHITCSFAVVCHCCAVDMAGQS